MQYEIVILFFVISVVYSSVGFGGGSSYLAILALFGINFQALKLTALICNIIVVCGGTYIFWKRGHLKLTKATPLVLLSVPLAFWGGRLEISERIFFLITGISLCLAGIILLWNRPEHQNTHEREKSRIQDSFVGGSIGFLSGLIGIGGGIFLSPFLHLTHWAKAKIIAATASFYILVNSIAGLVGQLSNLTQSVDWRFIFFLGSTVFIGGQIGSRMGSQKLSNLSLKRVTAVLVFFVGIRLLIIHF